MSGTDPALEERRAAVADFRRRWWRFVRQWRAAARRGPDEAVALVERALADGLPPVTDGDPQPPPPQVQDDAHRAVVAASGFLDADEYALQHRLLRRQDPARHYVETGWRTLRAPSLRFDLWHYWASHLDPTGEEVDPLLHYLLVGRHAGLAPLPEPGPTRTPTSYAAGQVVRRACLFAGYDADGLVDDYVVDYLTELARHADVFYVADGVLEPGQLDRLDGIVAGAWSVPHGAYDFGSFSLLARDLVGWERLDGYDEVILANDSCYLLRPLDDVLAEMDTRACDWWSLQATSMEHDESYVVDDAPIPLAEAKARFLGQRHWTDVRHLHLSSYFLVFRRPVLDDPGFRWRLDHVAVQADKMLVIHKYEVGISRYLTDAGFDFDTFIPELYAFHPLYSRHFFELVERGFPLVKRNFVGENPRHVLDLERWPERLGALVPDLRLEQIRANLDRVSPVDRLHEAHDIRLDTDGRRRLIPRRAVWGGALRTLDRESPTFEHWWAFVSSPTTGRLDPGVRAVLDEVRHDPSIHKVVLSRSRRLPDDVSGDNVTVLPIHTVDGQHALDPVRSHRGGRGAQRRHRPAALAVAPRLPARRHRRARAAARRLAHPGRGVAQGARRGGHLAGRRPRAQRRRRRPRARQGVGDRAATPRPPGPRPPARGPGRRGGARPRPRRRPATRRLVAARRVRCDVHPRRGGPAGRVGP